VTNCLSAAELNDTALPSAADPCYV